MPGEFPRRPTQVEKIQSHPGEGRRPEDNGNKQDDPHSFVFLIAIGGVLLLFAPPKECRESITQTVAFLVSWPAYVVVDLMTERLGRR